jgi:4a-hydroxytetrahydrobiopterin dehydratase
VLAPRFYERGLVMSVSNVEELSAKRCSACEGDIAKLLPEEVRVQLQALNGWQITPDGLRIRKDWQMKNFLAGIEFFNRVSRLAEEEGHHPDLHLENYRHAWIEIWTHSIGGLSENDFILAAKIDRLPLELKK